jgi:hypothetical protein
MAIVQNDNAKGRTVEGYCADGGLGEPNGTESHLYTIDGAVAYQVGRPWPVRGLSPLTIKMKVAQKSSSSRSPAICGSCSFLLLDQPRSPSGWQSILVVNIVAMRYRAKAMKTADVWAQPENGEVGFSNQG